MATIDNTSANPAGVKLPIDGTVVNFAALNTELTDGSAGLSQRGRAIRASIDGGLRVSQKEILLDDFFNHTILNSHRWQNTLTTMTTVMANGLLTLNSGGSQVTTVGDLLASYYAFEIPAEGNLDLEFAFSLAIAPQANNVLHLGIGVPGAATTLASDGVFFTMDSAGAFSLNAYYNNTTPATSAITFTPTPGRVYTINLRLNRSRADLFIDGDLYAFLERDISALTTGGLCQQQSGKIIAHLINSGATTGAQKLNLAYVAVAAVDQIEAFNPFLLRAIRGMTADHTPDGVAVGQLSNHTNSAAPASATLSNTAAGYSFPGGKFQFAAPAGAETDYAIFAYQVPAAAVNTQGKSLVVTGISISLYNTVVAVATTATVFEWSIGYGSTAVSLATADGAATRAAKRRSLGIQTLPIGAAVHAQAADITRTFPEGLIVVEPGTFFHVILKIPFGTATATEVFRGSVEIDGFFI